MMAPPSGMCGKAYLQKRNTERRFTAITRSQSSSGSSTIGPNVIIPALLTSTSMRPHFLIAASIAARTSVETETSARAKMASPCLLPSAARIARTVVSPLSALMSTTTTLPPSAANRSHVDRPMPEPPPVTRHTLFVKRMYLAYVVVTQAVCHTGRRTACLPPAPLRNPGTFSAARWRAGRRNLGRSVRSVSLASRTSRTPRLRPARRRNRAAGSYKEGYNYHNSHHGVRRDDLHDAPFHDGGAAPRRRDAHPTARSCAQKIPYQTSR